MTVYLSGDSNSVRRDGWVSLLAERLNGVTEFRNISIGGVPSQMSLFRALKESRFRKGDVFVWAYGINDALYLRKAKYKLEELIWTLRQIMRLCAEHEVAFAPMIFQLRRDSQVAGKSAYRKALHRLFDEYDLPFFDVDDAYLAQHSDARALPFEFYEDYLHYSHNQGVSEHLTSGALDLIGRARVPARVGQGLRPVRLLETFSGAEPGTLANSAVGSLTTWKPGSKGLEIALPGSGRIVGLFVATTLKGGAWTVSFRGHDDDISVACADRKFNRTMLKFISLEAMTGRSFRYRDGDALTISWQPRPREVLADWWFLKEMADENIQGQEARLVSVMVEDLTA